MKVNLWILEPLVGFVELKYHRMLIKLYVM